MTQEKIDELLLVGHFMEEENLFVFENQRDGIIGVYRGDDEEGNIDYKYDINWYNPDRDWNELMIVCKKIMKVYADNRENVFSGLHECDLEKTYQACVEFIKFWYDTTQEKMTWTDVFPEKYFKRKNIFA